MKFRFLFSTTPPRDHINCISRLTNYIELLAGIALPLDDWCSAVSNRAVPTSIRFARQPILLFGWGTIFCPARLTRQNCHRRRLSNIYPQFRTLSIRARERGGRGNFNRPNSTNTISTTTNKHHIREFTTDLCYATFTGCQLYNMFGRTLAIAIVSAVRPMPKFG